MTAMASASAASPLRRDKLILVNQRTDESLAERIEVAVTRRDRRKGLLGRTDFEALRQALLRGTVAASFTIEDFSLRRLTTLSRDELNQRIASFARMLRFE